MDKDITVKQWARIVSLTLTTLAAASLTVSANAGSNSVGKTAKNDVVVKSINKSINPIGTANTTCSGPNGEC